MNKIFKLLLLMALMTLPTWAEKVSKTQAQQIAENFLTQKGQRKAKVLLAQIPHAALRIPLNGNDAQAPFYIYNVENEGGFVIVAGDDAIGTTILGYGDKGAFQFENAPENVKAVLGMFARAVNNASKRKKTHRATDAVPSKGNVVVAPLLGDILWGQDAPFNLQMPTYTAEGATKHYYVGCVATAMAQIMRYHQYPAVGTGEKTYTANIGKSLTVNYGATTYDWTKMPAAPAKDNANEEENNQLSTLSYHAAVAVNMEFAPNGSGAYSQFVVDAMTNYFGYDKGMSYRVRDYYNTNEWLALIKEELDARRPVFYSASNEDGLGGHAFVCDGYDDQNYVHINWGWYGRSNGFFFINALNPDDLGIGANGGGYNLNQEIITGIQPRQTTENKPETPVYCKTRLVINQFNDGLIDAITFVESHSATAFKGKVALVLTDQNNQILAQLQDTELSLNAVSLKGGKILIDAKYFKIQRVTNSVSGVADGDNYKLLLAYQEEGENDWHILRTTHNLPNYSIATVVNGKITKVVLHTPTPDVTLLEKITTDGKLYAKGSAKFKLHVRNNTPDAYLNYVRLLFTSVDDPSQQYTLIEPNEGLQQVYDNSEKTIYLLIDLPQDMPAGRYKVTAFEKGHESHPFSESEVGETILEVAEEATTPIIRQIGNFSWIGAVSKTQEVKQGEFLLLVQPIRNYGLEGEIGILTRMQDVDNPDKIYSFLQVNHTLKRREVKSLQYYRRTDLPPGNYRVMSYYVVDGNEIPVEGEAEECIIEVKANSSLTLKANEFVFPARLEQGKRYDNLKVTFSAEQKTSGMLYIRIRQLTNTGGEMVTMKGITIPAGGTYELPFYYRPKADLKDGKYIVFLEFKPSGSKETVSVLGDNTKEVVVGVLSNIDNLPTDATTDGKMTIEDNCIIFANPEKVRSIKVYTLTGVKVYQKANISNREALPLANGAYIVYANTTDNIYIKKVVLQ